MTHGIYITFFAFVSVYLYIYIYIYICAFTFWGVTAMRSTSKSIGSRSLCKAECRCLTATMDDFCLFHMCQVGNSETIFHHTQTQNTKEEKATDSWGRGGLGWVWLSSCIGGRICLAPNARHGRRWHRLAYITFWTQSCWHQLQSIPSLLPLPSDPTVAIEADGQDGAKAILKKMTWPLMDDDALPSTYTTRVLTCLSKWRVKLQSLVEAFESDPDETENTKQNLILIIKLSVLHAWWCIYTTGHAFRISNWCEMNLNLGRLRVSSKAQMLDVWIIYDQFVFQSDFNLTLITSLDLALQPLHHSPPCPATSGIRITWLTAMMKPEPSALVWSGGPVVSVWAWSEPRT